MSGKVSAMRKTALLIALFCLILSGCSTSEGVNERQEEYDSLIPVEVIVKTDPEVIQSGMLTTVAAQVTHGTDQVEDAREVLFEIWTDGQEEHDNILGVHQGEGIYAITYTFPAAGTYFVIPHVTARGQHVMPTYKYDVK